MNILIMIWLFSVLGLLEIVESTPRYPNCLTNIPSNTTSSFNRNFIELTSFIFDIEDDSLKNAASNILIESNATLMVQQIETNRIQYFSLFGVIVVLCIVAFIIKTVCTKTSCARQFASKGLIKVVNPCLVLLSMLVFAIALIMTIIIPRIYESMDSGQCILKQLSQLITKGDVGHGWTGTNNQIIRLENSIEYLKIMETMPSSFDYSAKLFETLMFSHNNFTDELNAQYGAGVIQFTEGQSITMQQILPELFDPSDQTIMKQIQQSIEFLVRLSQIASNIEVSVQNSKESAQDGYLTLGTKIKYLQGQKQNFEQLFQNTLSRQTIYNLISQSAYLPLIFKIFITISIIGSFSYSLLVFLSAFIRHRKFNVMIDILWVLFVVLLLLGVFIIYSLFQIATKQVGHCQFYETLKDDRAIFQNISDIDKGTSNIFTYLQPCIYGNGSFPDLIHSSEFDPNFIHVMGNLSDYNNKMSISNGNYQKSYQFKSALEKAVSIVEKEQSNVRRISNYLNNAIDKLNDITYSDSLSEKCYKHKWVFNREDCGDISNILESSGNQLLAVNGINSMEEYCLVFYKQKKNGEPQRPINMAEFMSNYQESSPDLDCSQSYIEISNYGLIITSAMDLKSNALETLKQQLITQKQKLTDYLKIMRTNYKKKYEQYQHLLTMGGTVTNLKEANKIWKDTYSEGRNCSIVKSKISKIYQIFCLDLRADVLKVYLITTIILIIVGVIIILGIQYSCYKDVEQILEYQQAIEQEEKLMRGQEDSSQYNDNKINARKYIAAFFNTKKKKK